MMNSCLSLCTIYPNVAKVLSNAEIPECSVFHSIFLIRLHCGRSPSPSAPPTFLPLDSPILNLTLHSPTGNRSTEWFFADMSQPRYLTGDRAGIQEFLDKFDVRTTSLAGECH